MERLFEKSRAKVAEISTDYVRKIHEDIAWDDRLVAIVGARGVGKTTLVLQHIKLYDNTPTALYVTADVLWFTSHTLVELADTFYKHGGRTLYIDEVHRYPNWSVELKKYLRYIQSSESSLYRLVHPGYPSGWRRFESPAIGVHHVRFVFPRISVAGSWHRNACLYTR